MSDVARSEVRWRVWTVEEAEVDGMLVRARSPEAAAERWADQVDERAISRPIASGRDEPEVWVQRLAPVGASAVGPRLRVRVTGETVAAYTGRVVQ